MRRQRIALGIAEILVTLGIIGWLIYSIGTAPFVAALRSLSPMSVTAALGIGALATLIQAQRWRLVARGVQIDLGKAEAIGKCWQAAFLNSILPGGLVGDAIRAVEQRVEPEGTWRGSIGSVVSERLTATIVIMMAATIALFPRMPWLGLAASGIGLVMVVIVWPTMRRLSARARWAVFALAVAGWAIFAGLILIALVSGSQELTRSFLQDVSAVELFALISLMLASMSIPVSWAGWGPREGTAALVFPLFGFSAEIGVAVALSYGLLAFVSVLPGAGILLFRVVFNKRHSS